MFDGSIILTIEDWGEFDRRIENMRDDEDLMYRIHDVFKRYMEPYVPYGEGELSNTAEVTPEGVIYGTTEGTVNYAHYQYEGEVYGPNYPTYAAGSHTFTGWHSPAGETKYPTGRELGVQSFIVDKYGNIIEFGYDIHKHSKAAHHWDKVMIEDNGKNFRRAIRTNITRYLNGR